MSKAHLAAAQVQYDALVSRAMEAESRGDTLEAVRLAQEAWKHLPDMMKFEKKYEEGTFQSVPCIDMVLRLAPPLLDIDALTGVETLLKQNRSIDRDASDDLAARLKEARSRLNSCWRVLRLLETTDGARWLDLQQETQLNEPELRSTIESLFTVGLLKPHASDHPTRFRLNDVLTRAVHATCAACGCSEDLTLDVAVSLDACPACGRRDTVQIFATVRPKRSNHPRNTQI